MLGAGIDASKAKLMHSVIHEKLQVKVYKVRLRTEEMWFDARIVFSHTEKGFIHVGGWFFLVRFKLGFEKKGQ